MDRLTIVIFMLLGFSFLFMEEYNFRGISLQTANYPSFKVVGVLIILISLYMLLKYTKTKDEEEIQDEYTICPNCKETFNYDDLKKGKCPYCKDVDTVDIEQYYKDNPEEKEKGN
ncbi:hypothetical protein [Halarcobacter sp.]|uniref:hypothetical protein n=1 Tax=Halarcobacter sp. TaxID=2321133 RepID=UPI003AFF9FE9